MIGLSREQTVEGITSAGAFIVQEECERIELDLLNTHYRYKPIVKQPVKEQPIVAEYSVTVDFSFPISLTEDECYKWERLFKRLQRLKAGIEAVVHRAVILRMVALAM
jgi:hypothetical protein